MKENIIQKIILKDDKLACATSNIIISESQETNKWYKYFDDFASLLNHQKALVRNRVLYILAANAKCDDENRIDAIINDYLSHIIEEKPITDMQCIKALVQVEKENLQYIPKIIDCFHCADLSKYKDSIRPLIEQDIVETIKALTL